jgi:PAS domain S-box-containing protein
MTDPPATDTGPRSLVSAGASAAVPAGLFLAVGVAWIVFSDRVLMSVAGSPEAVAEMQTVKGIIFVLATSGLLYLLLHAQFSRQNRQAAGLIAAGERLRAQIENSPLALVEFDQAGRVARWSPRATELFGWTQAEVLGRTIDDLAFVHPDDRETLARRLAKSLDEGGLGSIHHNRNLRKDGSIVHCEWYNSWIRDASGEVSTMISLAQDVTWQREAVDEVNRLNRELEARVHQRTEELAVANADLKAFTWSISHDLRAPVRAIVGFGEILQRRHAGGLPDEGRTYLDHIVQAGNQMNRLIDGLLRYAQIDQDAVHPDLVDIEALVAEILPRLESLVSDPGGKVQIGPDLPALHGDRQLLESVLQNLLENGLRYRHPDRPPLVRIEGRREGGASELRVVDNGRGIPPEERGRAFTLFERIDPSPELPGSGLGLAIVKRALDRMGATIHIQEGDQGRGTAFVLRFPDPGAAA